MRMVPPAPGGPVGRFGLSRWWHRPCRLKPGLRTRDAGVSGEIQTKSTCAATHARSAGTASLLAGGISPLSRTITTDLSDYPPRAAADAGRPALPMQAEGLPNPISRPAVAARMVTFSHFRRQGACLLACSKMRGGLSVDGRIVVVALFQIAIIDVGVVFPRFHRGLGPLWS